MSNINYVRTLLLVGITLWLPQVCAAPSVVCGTDPVQNTRTLQRAISNAKPSDTLVLPPGVCVLAKCEADPTASCKGASGPHLSALYIGNKLNSNLELVGDPGGTSVLKLDPNPARPRQPHPYCSDTHVLSIETISHVTLRGFTIDGSEHDLPDDAKECPKLTDAGVIEFAGFAKHMHGVYVQNASDVEIVDMELINAHGDGLNLVADLHLQPLTHGVTVRNTNFLGNKRSGIAFQRNVSQVLIADSRFRNSGTDQDLDMESTGGNNEANQGPSDIDITNNVFERVAPHLGPRDKVPSGVAVTLGAGNTQPGRKIRFTGNTIKPAPGSNSSHGGCILVDNAEHLTIASNTVIGTTKCHPVRAKKVRYVTIEGNKLHGYRKAAQGNIPSAVVSIAAHTAKTDKHCMERCEYQIHYADEITIRNNQIVQHVPSSSGVDLDGADYITVSDNHITAANDDEPVDTVPDDYPRSAGVVVTAGVHPLNDGDFYVDERKVFNATGIQANVVKNFNNGILIQRNPATTIYSVALTGNSLSSNVLPPRGIYLKGDSSFVTNLTVDRNLFGCGFVPQPPVLGPNAFVRPPNQAHQGNVGTAIPGNPTPCL
jgi:hypothetical protein